MQLSALPTRYLVVAVVAALLVAATGASVAVSDPRDAPSNTEPPVRVYVSETLDISDVQLTGGGTVGTDQTTFVSVRGDEVFSVAPERADFDGIEPGSYDADSDTDSRADLVAVRPRITDFDVRNERGVDIAGDTVDGNDFEEVRLTVEYNFAEADYLEVTVETPDGLDLAGNRRITTNGGQLTIDTSGADPGTYRISVEGSNIEAGAASTTVTVAGETTATARPTPTDRPATETPTATARPTATEQPATTTPTATARPTATDRPATATPTDAPSATPSPTPPTTGDGAGFGLVAALVALAGAALVARRRD